MAAPKGSVIYVDKINLSHHSLKLIDGATAGIQDPDERSNQRQAIRCMLKTAYIILSGFRLRVPKPAPDPTSIEQDLDIARKAVSNAKLKMAVAQSAIPRMMYPGNRALRETILMSPLCDGSSSIQAIGGQIRNINVSTVQVQQLGIFKSSVNSHLQRMKSNIFGRT